MIALQYWFDFCHTSKWISHRCTYILPLKTSLPPPTLSHRSRSWQSPGLSSPSHTRNFHLLSILHVFMCMLPRCVCALSHSVLSDWFWPHGLVARQAPLSMEFSRQEYCPGLPCPLSGDLPDPGIEPKSSTLLVDSLPSEPPWEAACFHATLSQILRVFLTVLLITYPTCL